MTIHQEIPNEIPTSQRPTLRLLRPSTPQRRPKPERLSWTSGEITAAGAGVLCGIVIAALLVWAGFQL